MKKYYEFDVEYYSIIGADNKTIEEVIAYYEQNVSDLDENDISCIKEITEEDILNIFIDNNIGTKEELDKLIKEEWFYGFNIIIIDGSLCC